MEELLQKAVKRALEQSVSEMECTGGASSTPKKDIKGQRQSLKKPKVEMEGTTGLSLDESIISSAKDYVSDSIDGAVSKITESDNIGAKNKKIAEIVLKELKSELISAVNKALELFFKEVVERLDEKIDRFTATEQRSALLAHYEADKLEQYSRRESFRITGIDIPAGTDSVDAVCSLAKDIGVELSKNDIVACHPVGAKNGNRKQILCRLTSRIKRDEVFMNKKKLKSLNDGKVFLNEDLTPLRAKILTLVKESTEYKPFTLNGRVVVFDKNKGKRIYIESPDDLFRVGIDVDQDTLKKLGLSRYLTVP